MYYSACHTGRQGTWTNIGRLDQHRIDYVCIPQDFLPFCEHSQVVDSFDAGNAHEDHTATAMQLVWHDECNRASRQRRVARHDRARIATNKDKICLNQIQVADWSTDIETQVTHLNTNLLATLKKTCPIQPSLPKNSFISSETWSYATPSCRAENICDRFESAVFFIPLLSVSKDGQNNCLPMTA